VRDVVIGAPLLQRGCSRSARGRAIVASLVDRLAAGVEDLKVNPDEKPLLDFHGNGMEAAVPEIAVSITLQTVDTVLKVLADCRILSNCTGSLEMFRIALISQRFNNLRLPTLDS